MLCTMNNEAGSSIIATVNVEDGTTEVIKDQKEKIFSYDLERVPGCEEAYFILHQGGGLYLIDPSTKTMYNLRLDND